MYLAFSMFNAFLQHLKSNHEPIRQNCWRGKAWAKNSLNFGEDPFVHSKVIYLELRTIRYSRCCVR